jgi:hypothetical protein
MKKYIYVMNAIEQLSKVLNGKRVEGVLYMDEDTGRLTFKAYNRQSRVRPKDRMICQLEHGWVKESKERYKLFESVPKELGAVRVMKVMDREVKEAKSAIVDWELVGFL